MKLAGLHGPCAQAISACVLQVPVSLHLPELISACISHAVLIAYMWSQVCTNCGTTSTPLWRKEGGQLMCNACGIYFKNHGYHRWAMLWRFLLFPAVLLRALCVSCIMLRAFFVLFAPSIAEHTT